jgi:hypothetical protein
MELADESVVARSAAAVARIVDSIIRIKAACSDKSLKEA